MIRVHVARLVRGALRDRLGGSLTVNLTAIQGLGVRGTDQAVSTLLTSLGEMKPPGMAGVLHNLPETRTVKVAVQSSDGRLADVLEELEEHGQVKIVSPLKPEHVVDVLDVM